MVPSGEITNLPYLLEIARQNAKIFLSTGISPMRWYEVLGRAARHAYAADELIDRREAEGPALR